MCKDGPITGFIRSIARPIQLRFYKEFVKTGDGDWYDIAPLPYREQRGGGRETGRFRSSNDRTIDPAEGSPNIY